MDINQILIGLDTLFAEDKMEEAEEYMIHHTQAALHEGDLSAVLTLLNELVGYYRSVGKHEQAIAMANQAEQLMISCGFEGTVAFATTLLNKATALRAGGRAAEALNLYEKVKQIYDEQLEENDYLVAGLYNNWSGAFDQEGEYQQALNCLKKAETIISKMENKQIELATTYTNMAAVYAKMGDFETAKTICARALEIFEAEDGNDYHYPATKQLWEELNR
ncbi:MAG: tetratricopeptide repeat protein [Lachnospiraceae bacterium]